MINDNSIWPNGMQTDEEGYAIFCPMGTNKVEIPKNSPHWPKGSKLVGSFVYDKNNKLVGFCDTKAMTTSTNNGEIIVMPYEHIEADFDSIEKNGVQIHAPKATYKKASWNGSVEKEDIPDIDYKYKGCKYVSDIKTVDENYLENDIKDGCWTELLSSNITGHDMFNGCETLISFKSDLSSLDYGINTFRDCINLTSFEADLSLLNNGNSMFGGCTNLSNFESNLDSLSFGLGMFNNCSSLTSFKCDLSSLTNGQQMFQGCSKLMTFTSDLSSLTNGNSMFSGCSNLTSFESNLDSLSFGQSMFQGCSSLSSFDTDLNSLTNGIQMFNRCETLSEFKSDLSSLDIAQSMFLLCSNLVSFKTDLKRVTDAASMFNGCKKLTHFKSDLDSLVIGQNMFHSCSSLTKFDCDNLSSLTTATNMFYNCKLDISSIKNIIDTINTVSSETESPNILIGMGCNNNQTDKDIFAQEVGYSDMDSLLLTITNKGWTVTTQYNGRPSSNYSLRQPEPLPIFVKLVEVSSADEDSFYEYTSNDGSKFYNLDWFHETTGSTDGYTQFNSLEESISSWNIVPKE